MSLKWSHVLIYILGGICCWLVLFAWGDRHIKTFHMSTIRGSLQHHARMAEVLFSISDSTPDSEVDAIQEKLQYHIAVIDRQGRTVSDSLLSGADLGAMGNQLDHREIEEAARQGMGSDLRYFHRTGGWFLHVAVPLSNGGGFIRVSTAVSGPEPTLPPD